jgi:inner membrane protein
MPSAFTHAFVGAAAAELAPLPARRWPTGIAFAVLAALPDLDVVAFRLGIPYQSPFGHRGGAHSLTVAALLAVLYAARLHHATRPLGRAWWTIVGLAFVACASHGLLDACTDGGLGVALLWPFSDARIFFPWRPIPVSPLSASEFFSAVGLHIMLAEMLWIWLPVLLVVASSALVRRSGWRRRSRSQLRPMRR